MDDVDAEYYANVLRELAADMVNALDRFEVEFLNTAAAFIERQQAKIETLERVGIMPVAVKKLLQEYEADDSRQIPQNRI